MMSRQDTIQLDLTTTYLIKALCTRATDDRSCSPSRTYQLDQTIAIFHRMSLVIKKLIQMSNGNNLFHRRHPLDVKICQRLLSNRTRQIEPVKQ